MLLLRMTVGRWAPLCSILDPALWSVYRKAAFPSAFIRGAVGIEKVLAMAFMRMGVDDIHRTAVLLCRGASILPLSCFHELHKNVLCLLEGY